MAEVTGATVTGATVTGAEATGGQNQHAARFKQFLVRGVTVARQRIEAEGDNTPISDAARERAQNVLRYAAGEDEAWAAMRELLLIMAPKMEMAGYREQWLDYLLAGLAQSQRLGDKQTEAALRFQCGYLYRLMSNYGAAQTLLETSAAYYAEAGEKHLQARALNQLAYLAWQQGHNEQTVALADTALKLLDEDDLERAMSLSALGLSAFRQRQWQQAAAYHRQALTIRTAHAQRREMAWSLQNLADALRGQGNYETAVTYFKEAIALLHEVRDPVYQATIQMNLGIVYSIQGKSAQALELYRAAEEVFRRFTDGLNLAKVITNQGLEYLGLQAWLQAEHAFTTSAELFLQFNNQGEHLNALDGLGVSYLEQGRFTEALTIFSAITAQMPQLEGTYFYQSLNAVLDGQITRAQQGLANT